MVSLDRLLNVGLIIVFFIGSAFLSFLYWRDNYSQPRRYISSVVLNSPAVPGDDLIIQVVRDVHRICFGRTSRFLLTLEPKTGIETQVYVDDVPTIAAPIGLGLPIKIRMPTPKDIKCGSYVYRAVMRADCDGHIFVQEIPAAPFQVCK